MWEFWFVCKVFFSCRFALWNCFCVKICAMYDDLQRNRYEFIYELKHLHSHCYKKITQLLKNEIELYTDHSCMMKWSCYRNLTEKNGNSLIILCLQLTHTIVNCSMPMTQKNTDTAKKIRQNATSLCVSKTMRGFASSRL